MTWSTWAFWPSVTLRFDFPLKYVLPGGLTLNKLPAGVIRFEDVHFSYPTRTDNPPILNGLNLELSPAKVTAIVGASGSGKSTIVSLLLRLYDPNKGRITLDGEDVKNLDPHWLRSLVGTVSQVCVCVDI